MLSLPDNRTGTATMRLFLILAMALLPSTSTAQTELGTAASEITKKLHDDGVKQLKGKRLFIARFRNINGKGDAVPEILQEKLTTEFIKKKHFKVVERAQLQKALDELQFDLKDVVDSDKAVKVGKLAGAAYVLVGSVADVGSENVAINARILEVETGDNVAAEEASINTGGKTTPADVASPDHPNVNAPPVDLNEKAKSEEAGEWLGRKENFGLLGGGKFRVAWREKLDRGDVLSFSAGKVLGDGSYRLVLVVRKQHVIQPVLEVLKWAPSGFKLTWQSERIDQGSYLRILPRSDGPDVIITSGSGSLVEWRWNGRTYTPTSRSLVSVTDVIPGKRVLIVGVARHFTPENYARDRPFLGELPPDKDASDWMEGANVAPMSSEADGFTATAGDFDGDGRAELAIVRVRASASGNPIEIYGIDLRRKALTETGYGGCLTTWSLASAKTPWIVARRNDVGKEGLGKGGNIYLIRWNGESYEEVWKSIRLDDAVLDMQVCDPKGEGKLGLVVLSADKKGCYLTKIVAN